MTIAQEIKTNHEMEITTKTVTNLIYTARIVEEAILEVLKPYHLTLPQYNVLRILKGQAGKPANLSTISERMIHSSSNTTRLVDKLILKGFCERTVCKNNRRKVEILITEKGLHLLKNLNPEMDANNKRILKNMSHKQQDEVNITLDTIRTFKK